MQKIDLKAAKELIELNDPNSEYVNTLKALTWQLADEIEALRAYSKSDCCCGGIGCSRDHKLRQFYRGIKDANTNTHV